MGLGRENRIRRFRENRMPIFYCAGCKFLWLAHWSKGEEVRVEMELVANTLRWSTDQTLGLKAPDAGCMRPVELVGLHSTEGIAPNAGLCPVKVDRTRPVEEIRLGELTGNDRMLRSSVWSS